MHSRPHTTLATTAPRLALLYLICMSAAACGTGEPAEDSTAAVRGESQAEVDESDVDRLMALGYVDTVQEERSDLPEGAQVIDSARISDGLNFYVNTELCSAELMTSNGVVLKSWRHEPCLKWGNAVLLANGDVLAIHRNPSETARESFEARRLLKFDWDGELLWSRELPVHHDVDLMPDGRIAVLTYRHRKVPETGTTLTVRDHFVAILNPDGKQLEEASLTELLLASPRVFKFRVAKKRRHEGIVEIDPIHSNSIEWMRDPELAKRHPRYGPSNFLLCSRNQNSVMIIDWDTKKVVWTWGQGEIWGPHDATVLPNGNILLFDNGLLSKSSRVLEVDPDTDEIVWSYQASNPQDFFSIHRGAAQRLANGNTLITDSASGRAFEVTSEGEMVWTYVNPNRSVGGDRVVIVRTRRVLPLSDDLAKPTFAWSD